MKSLIYESPDGGKTVYARESGDYSTRWLVNKTTEPITITQQVAIAKKIGELVDEAGISQHDKDDVTEYVLDYILKKLESKL